MTHDQVEKELQAAINKNPAHICQFAFGLEVDADGLFYPREDEVCPIGMYLIGKKSVNRSDSGSFIVAAAMHYLGITEGNLEDITSGFDHGKDPMRLESRMFYHIGQRLYNYWQDKLAQCSREDFLREIEY